jgi:hypothetical protein
MEDQENKKLIPEIIYFHQYYLSDLIGFKFLPHPIHDIPHAEKLRVQWQRTRDI